MPSFISTGTMTLSGTNITLNTTAGSNIIQISGNPGGGTLSMWPQQPENLLMSVNATLFTTNTGNQTTFTGFISPIAIDAPLKFNALNIVVSNSFTTATTSISSVNYSYTMGASFGVFTNNANTLSLHSSWSMSMAYRNRTAAAAANGSLELSVWWGGSSFNSTTQGMANASNIQALLHGSKVYPLVWSTSTHSLSAGQYYGVWEFSSSTGGAAQATLASIGFNSKTYSVPGQIGAATGSTTAAWPFLGRIQVINSESVFPNFISTSRFTSAGSDAGSMNSSVWFQMYVI
jgi:hypothetical protein